MWFLPSTRGTLARTAATLPLFVALLAAQPVPSTEAPARIQPGTLPSAQTEPDFPLATPQSVAPEHPQPLDIHGKLNYFINSTTSAQTLGRIGLTSALGHYVWGGGDWGNNPGDLAERMESRYLEHLTRRGVQFAIGAARGEDPRFYRSQREGFWHRTKFVLSRTVLTQMDNGATSIAVGRLAGFAAGNFATSYLHPANPNPWTHTLTSTGVNVGGDVAMRMLREFWPDIKSKLKR